MDLLNLKQWLEYNQIDTKNEIFSIIYNNIDKNYNIFVDNDIIDLVGFNAKEKSSRKRDFNLLIKRTRKLKNIVEIKNYNNFLNNDVSSRYIKFNYYQASDYIKKNFNSVNDEYVNVAYGLKFIDHHGDIKCYINWKSMYFIVLSIDGLINILNLSYTTKTSIEDKKYAVNLLKYIELYKMLVYIK